MRRVRKAARGVLAGAVGRDWRDAGPTGVARRLGVDAKLAWKLVHLAGNDGEALAAVRYVPGPAALRRFCDAAAKAGASADDADKLRRAADAFRHLSREAAGGTREMRLLAARHAVAPDPGDEAELRRGAFDAYAYATGLRARALWWGAAMVPAGDDEIGLAVIRARVGMQRLRPEATWRVFPSYRYDDAGRVAADAPAGPLEPDLDPRAGPPLVPAFCDGATARWRPVPGEGWGLAPGEVGGAGQMTVALGERFGGGEPRRSPEPLVNSFLVAAAAEALVCDHLVHRDLLNNPRPRASVALADGGQDHAQAELVPASLEVIPSGILCDRGFRCRHVPRSAEMARHLVDRLGREPGEFVAYRLVLPWPMFATIARFEWDRA